MGGNSVYMAKYWREYRIARKRGHTPAESRKIASELAREWYSWIKFQGHN